MRRIRLLIAVALAAVGLAGCAAIPEVPYDRSTAGDIKTIGLVTPYVPEHVSVVLASDVGQSFGLIGALVDAQMRSDREFKFGKILVAKSYDAPTDFLGTLTKELQGYGYAVETIAMDHKKPNFVDHYPADKEPKVDAYLDVLELGYGYLAAGISSSNPYRPAFAVRAKLVRAKDNAVLMQDIVIYNPLGNPKNAITLTPDPNYHFTDFDTLVGSPDDAVKGLQIATEQSAQTLASLVK